MRSISIFEFEALVPNGAGSGAARQDLPAGTHGIPESVYRWLERECRRAAAEEQSGWLRLARRGGLDVVQVRSFVGVIRAPDGFQIEVLPKHGVNLRGGIRQEGVKEARRILVRMLACLPGFRHVRTAAAELSAERMPLLEIFIAEFLGAVERLVKSGVRGDYSIREDNLSALRGKLQMAEHLRQNLFRADRFFTQHDEFSADRPENRLLNAALQRVLLVTASQGNHQLARQLQFVFADIPASMPPWVDFQRVRLDRGMGYYADALAWARLILDEQSPLTGIGSHRAPSLLFPMEAVFEAFVARGLAAQLEHPHVLRTKVRSRYLVCHSVEDVSQHWFQLRPDFVIRDDRKDVLVLDAKWKLLDESRANGTAKYGLSQADFYQLRVYGRSYLEDQGQVVLIYPETDRFKTPMKFGFPDAGSLQLWVLPFFLGSSDGREPSELRVPDEEPFRSVFRATWAERASPAVTASTAGHPSASGSSARSGGEPRPGVTHD